MFAFVVVALSTTTTTPPTTTITRRAAALSLRGAAAGRRPWSWSTSMAASSESSSASSSDPPNVRVPPAPKSASAIDIVPVRVEIGRRGDKKERLGVTIFEARDQDAVLEVSIDDGSDPFGAVCWPSALAAARRLVEIADSRGGLGGLKVVELGAGPGLASMVAFELGADVVATDVSDLALRLVTAGRDRRVGDVAKGSASSSMTGTASFFDVRRLDVADVDAVRAVCAGADVIVASDMLYERALARHLGYTIRAFCPPARAIVCDPGRTDGRKAFFNALAVDGTVLTPQEEEYWVFDPVVLEPDDVRAIRLGRAAEGAATTQSGPSSGNKTPVTIGILEIGSWDGV